LILAVAVFVSGSESIPDDFYQVANMAGAKLQVVRRGFGHSGLPSRLELPKRIVAHRRSRT
jgi:hypothetical protein